MRYMRKSKRSFKRGKRAYKPKYRRTSTKRKGLTKLIKKVALGTQETKRSIIVNAAKQTVPQATLLTLDTDPFLTTQGVRDPSTSVLKENRIGDEVTPVRLVIKFMVALDPRQSMVKFRWMLIKGPVGEIVTAGNLFCGICQNQQLDLVDTEKWTVVAQKRFQITRPNPGVSSPTYTTTIVQQGGQDTGMEYDGKQNQQWAPKLCQVSLKGSKFGKRIKYQNGSTQLKTWTYTSCLIAYGCDQATDPGFLISATSLARMDDYVSIFYYKDA